MYCYFSFTGGVYKVVLKSVFAFVNLSKLTINQVSSDPFTLLRVHVQRDEHVVNQQGGGGSIRNIGQN